MIVPTGQEIHHGGHVYKSGETLPDHVAAIVQTAEPAKPVKTGRSSEAAE